MRSLFDLGQTMRDGVRLSADVYLPEAEDAVPAILMRTPYDNTRADYVALARFFTTVGYAVVLQDCRGRGDSDGIFVPWLSDFDDGYDAVEWVAAQQWCNGQVGMLGGSYLAWAQWAALTQRPPHLVTMVTSGSPGRWLRDWPFRWGAFWAEDYVEWVNRCSGRSYQPATIIDWSVVHHQRVPREMDAVLGRPMPHWQEVLDHPTMDAFWERHVITGYETFDLPVLHITGWFDACAPGELHHFREMVTKSPAAERQTLLLGAWDHGGACGTGKAVAGEFDLGPDATIDIRQVWLDWFDTWLRTGAKPSQDWPRVRYYAMGANRWSDADAWPPSASTRQSLYLSNTDARLLPTPPSESVEVRYAYDPNDPTPALDGLTADPLPEWAPRSTTFLEGRPDTVVYTSDPFTEALEIVGPVHLILYASSDAPDTDFAALLSDVAPMGTATLLSHGILRASFRESLSNPTPLARDKIHELTIELADIAHVVLPGHRLRLLVLSSLFPYYHPNPNTGDLYGDETENRRVVANQIVWSGEVHPSRLEFLLKPS